MNWVRGTSLVELMTVLAIGCLLVAGAVSVFASGRNTYELNEATGRLQETARYVISVIEPDIELAGYYGFTNSAESLRLVSGSEPGIVYAVAAGMRRRALWPQDPEPAPVAALPASAHACGSNFAVDVLAPVEGSNGSWFTISSSCAAWSLETEGGHRPGSDTLTIRRASTVGVEPEPGRLQLYAQRLRSQTSQRLFFDGVAPGPVDDDGTIHDLVVRTYYISQDSVGRPGHPALRVKNLTTVSGEPRFIDTEVMPGVEDLQVQFGIDTADYDGDGEVDAGRDVDGNGVPETAGRATRYVDPDFPALHRYQVVAVRLWFRIRADRPEAIAADHRTYEYADVRYEPTGSEQRYRRVLVSRTITLRNARTT